MYRNMAGLIMNIAKLRISTQNLVCRKFFFTPKDHGGKVQHSLCAVIIVAICMWFSACTEMPIRSAVNLPVEFIDYMPMEENTFQRISPYFGYQYQGRENDTPRLLIFHTSKNLDKKQLLAAVNVDGVVVNDYSRKSVFAISNDGQTLLYMHDQPIHAPKDLQDKMPGLYEYVHDRGDRLIYPNAGFISHTTFHLAKNAMEHSIGDPNDPDTEHYIRNTDGDEFIQEGGLALLHGGTPLHKAAVNGDIPLIDSLIRKGADLDARDNRGFTPLHTAIWEKQELAAMRLIEEGANIKARMEGSLKWSPLEEASRFGLANVVNLLLDLSMVTDKGISINEKNAAGFTPLHLALDYRKYTVVKILIDRGANIDVVREADSVTPLHLFSAGLRDERSPEWERSQVEKLLNTFIEKGADINARDFLGATPLHYAVLNNNLKTAKVLIANGGLPSELELTKLQSQAREVGADELLTLQQRIDRTVKSDWWKFGATAEIE